MRLLALSIALFGLIQCAQAQEVILRPTGSGTSEAVKKEDMKKERDPYAGHLAVYLNYGATLPSTPGIQIGGGRAPIRHFATYNHKQSSFAFGYSPEFWATVFNRPLVKVLLGSRFTYYSVKEGQIDSSLFADGFEGLIPGVPYAGVELETPQGIAVTGGVSAKTPDIRGAFLFARVGYAFP